MNNTKFNIAVFIDGDNAQAKLIKELLEEVSKYGKATIRRIYGDWTIPQMNSWKEVINKYSINPIQKEKLLQRGFPKKLKKQLRKQLNYQNLM